MKHFGKRFLSPQDLGRYARDLKVAENPFQENLLEFLEKEHLLVPVCRVRYPDEIVRAYWVRKYPQWEDSSLPVEKNEERLAAIEDLDRKIHYWGQAHISEGWYHPFDVIDPVYSEFIEQHVADKPFQPWDTFKTAVGKNKDSPLYENTVDTYYHYWQIFTFAEALTMGVSVLVDSKSPRTDVRGLLECKLRLSQVFFLLIAHVPLDGLLI